MKSTNSKSPENQNVCLRWNFLLKKRGKLGQFFQGREMVSFRHFSLEKNRHFANKKNNQPAGVLTHSVMADAVFVDRS